MVSIRIIPLYIALSSLIIFCTFWLSTFQQFGGIAVGYVAFSSVMLVLTKFASFIAFGDGKLAVGGMAKSFQVISAGFLKFIAPPLVIYWGIHRGFSALLMAIGLVVGLLTAVLTLVLFDRFETARTLKKIV